MPELLQALPPGTVLLLGAALLPLLRGRLLQLATLALPLLSALHLAGMPTDTWALAVGTPLPLQVRVDALSLVWGWVFHVAAFLGAIYALGNPSRLEASAAAGYAGAAIAATFAADLPTLFLFWELTAVTSVWLVFNGPDAGRFGAALRYLAMSVTSGVMLLAGTVLLSAEGASLAFGPLGLDGSAAHALVFAAFGIKAAFPLVHGWVRDAYPRASASGTVYLSAFTTKLAVYALARGFAGEDILLDIGLIMAIVPLFYAAAEHDLRRVLAWSLNHQVGFMVVGVGIGTELALNGVAAHAVAHILYKSLLFMAMGVVLTRTGTVSTTQLGALARPMPLTAAFAVIGGAAASGMPGTSAFVTKSMILAAAAEEGLGMLYLGLLVAGVGVALHAGLRVTYSAFYAPAPEGGVPSADGGPLRAAPPEMAIAMAMAAALSLALGLFPRVLTARLPFPVTYEAYTADHVVTQLQLLLGTAVAFGLLLRIGAYPAEQRTTLQDTDVILWQWLPPRIAAALNAIDGVRERVTVTLLAAWSRLTQRGLALTSPEGNLGRQRATGEATLSVAVLLTLYAMLFFNLGDSLLVDAHHDDGHSAHDAPHDAPHAVPRGATHDAADAPEGAHGAPDVHAADSPAHDLTAPQGPPAEAAPTPPPAEPAAH